MVRAKSTLDRINALWTIVSGVLPPLVIEKILDGRLCL
jgi:hypothetical protein